MIFLSCTYSYEPWWAYLLRMLIEGTAELLLYATPVAMCVVVWDVFANKERKPAVVSFLGLDESTPTPLPSANSVFPLWTVLLYLITATATFELGLLIFDAVQALS